MNFSVTFSGGAAVTATGVVGTAAVFAGVAVGLEQIFNAAAPAKEMAERIVEGTVLGGAVGLMASWGGSVAAYAAYEGRTKDGKRALRGFVAGSTVVAASVGAGLLYLGDDGLQNVRTELENILAPEEKSRPLSVRPESQVDRLVAQGVIRNVPPALMPS